VVGPKGNDGVVFDPRCNELLIARIEVVGRPGLNHHFLKVDLGSGRNTR
jgi:hypothetical protein